MFRVDRNQNRLSRLTQKKFGDLALRERDHLQEWLVHQPDALGEELLIIQKEFDGFDETRERLDLLALDKQGNLVVIENKLDDSGRDVTWQALKYTAYVSGLNKGQIVEIYQQYLDRYCGGGSASQRLCEFMEVEELEETVLNPGNGQRMIFIAANFRREVTATVLWLLSRGIRAQCFKVSPYSYGDELFIDLQQIIPPPEAADYMIGISSKEVAETTAQSELRRSHRIRPEFWEAVNAAFRLRPVGLFPNVSASTNNWTNSVSADGCHFSLILTQSKVMVRFNLDRSVADENKWLFDQLYLHKDDIEAAINAALVWRRMDDAKASRIEAHLPCEGFDQRAWPDAISWLADTADNMQRAISPRLQEAVLALKHKGGQR